ncbi:MFS transporter [bacterium]|nr:MFS transporter [bacterium]
MSSESRTSTASKAGKKWIIFGLMISVALSAIDMTIVTTALPTIVAQLSGVELYSWLVSVYLLTSTTTVPLYGQLADNYGRKPILLFGIVLFTLASVACAQAGTMTQLILFRALQGVGAGAILPMTMTIIGDVFTIEERARYQGFFSGVWGVSSIVGPALGAFILTVWSWHGIFLINLPIGVLALFLIIRFYHEEKQSSHRSVDIWGALLLTGGVGSLLLAIEGIKGLEQYSLLLYLVAAVGLTVLVLVERRVSSPILPLEVIRQRVIGVSYGVTLLAGMLQFGVTAFIPLFVQGAMGGTPASVGMTMAPMAIGWPIGSVLSGRLILKYGYKRVMTIGLFAGVLAAFSLLLVDATVTLPVIVGIVTITGFSMGLTSTPLIIAVQNAVDWQKRGSTTALAQFSRTIGGVVGVAVMGGLINNRLATSLASSPVTSGVNAEKLLRDMLEPSARAGYSVEVLDTVRSLLASALHSAYYLPFVAILLAFLLLMLFFPGGRLQTNESESSKKERA